jgi:hypothetical protein
VKAVCGPAQKGVGLGLAGGWLRDKSRAGGRHALGYGNGGFAGSCRELLPTHARHREDEVEAVEERARELVPVAREPLRRAAALGRRVATSSARTEVHRCDQLKSSGEHNAAGSTRDRYEAVLERLPQRLERRPLELGELIEQKHAAVGEARLARTQMRPSADDRSGRRAVVRRAKGCPRDEWMLPVDEPGNRMDPRHLERGVGLERRQDPRQPAREHRLPRAGRTAEENVVPTGRGQLERAPGAFLPADVGQIRCRRCAMAVRRERLLGLELALSAQIRDRLGEVPDRDRGYSGERSLPRRVGRAEKSFGAEPACALGDGEDSSDPAQAAVERELADGSRPLERAARQLQGRREERERNRQIEARSLLAQLRRSQIDRDAPFGKLQLGGGNPAADPLTCLLASAVGETDDRETGDAIADVRFHIDPARFEADERMGDRACKHALRLRANS